MEVITESMGKCIMMHQRIVKELIELTVDTIYFVVVFYLMLQLHAVNNSRYIVFPQKKQCCFCCDSDHGCGILKRNWLDGAKFVGTDKIIDTNYNKWSKDGDFGYNYFWVTADDKEIPRRLDESGTHITDYLVHTFVNKTFDDSYFALPSYCSQTQSCPLTTICGKLRG